MTRSPKLRPSSIANVATALLVCGLTGVRAFSQSAASDARLNATVESHVVTIDALGGGAFTVGEEIRVTVYNVNGAERFREVTEHYSNSSSVETIEGEMSCPGQKRPVVAKKKDVRDYAAYDGFSLASDARVKALGLPIPTAYPAQYVTRTVRRVRETVALSPVVFAYGNGVAVKQAELRITGQRGEVLRKVIDPAGLLTQTTEGDADVYRLKDRPAETQREDLSPGWMLAGPTLLLGVREGALGGSRGDFTDWRGIGTWTAELLAQRNTLPEAARRDIESLVAGVDDPYRRIDLVYDYMQARTHYVSIQLGIGGFLPMEPAEVHDKGYGDCKALSNYTRLLLGAAGLPANYCVIGAGDRTIAHPDFASVVQMNHAILGVPLARDTVWLECTSQTAPTGHLGDFTAGRSVLWISEGSGSLVRTKGALPEQNVASSRGRLTLHSDGKAELVQTLHRRGVTIDDWHDAKLGGEPAILRQLQRAYATGFQKEALSVDILEGGEEPVCTVQLRGHLQPYAKVVGTRLVAPGFGFKPPPPAPRDTVDRRQAVEIPLSYRTIDTLSLVLPEGYQLSGLPELVEEVGPQGSYGLSAKPVPGGVELVRTLTIYKGLYAPAEAGAMARFAERVRRADGTYLVGVEVGANRT